MRAAHFRPVSIAVWTVCVAFLASSGPGCSPDSRNTKARVVVTTSTVASNGRSIGETMRRAPLAFRMEGDELHASRPTHDVRVDATGTVHFRAATRDQRPGEALELTTERVSRANAVLDVHTRSVNGVDGRVVLDRGEVVEELENRDEGTEQRWRFAERPRGGGDLVVRIRTKGLSVIATTPTGAHLANADGVTRARYGGATFIDAAGTRTEASMAVHDGAIDLTVPAEVVETAEYPAVLDPIVGSEFVIDQPVYAPSGGGQEYPYVAYGGGVFLVVWGDRRNLGEQLYAARVSATTGAILDPSGFIVSSAASGGYYPGVAFDGTNFLITWQDQRQSPGIYAARVTPAGALLDGPPATGGFVVGAGIGNAYPAVGFDGTNFLVVWNQSNDLYGARVDRGGHLLDSTPLPMVTYPGTQLDHHLAFDGANYLLVWSDDRAGSPTYGVYGTRVTPAGTVLDGGPTSGGFGIATGISIAGPQLAFDGTNYLVVAGDLAQQAQIWGVRVAPTGTLPDGTSVTAPFPIFTNPSRNAFAAVAFDGTNYLVSQWTGPFGAPEIRVGRVTPARTLLDGPSSAPGLFVGTSDGYGSLRSAVFGGGYHYLVWTDSLTRIGGPALAENVVGTRLSTAALPLDGPSTNHGVYVGTRQTAEDSPVVAYGSGEYLVVWNDGRPLATVGVAANDIYAARVDAMGTVLDPNGIPVSTAPGTQASPTVTYDGQNFVIAWRDERAGYNPMLNRYNSNVYVARMRPDGTLLDGPPSSGGIGIVTGPTNASAPTIASSTLGSIVSWNEARGGLQGNIYAARLALDGTLLDPVGGFLVAQRSSSLGSPNVVFDGANYFIAWVDYSNYSVTGMRLAPSGALLDGTTTTGGVLISNAPSTWTYAPCVATDGAQYLVTWGHERSGTMENDVHSARVSTAGILLDGPPGSIASGLQIFPRTDYARGVVYDGLHFLVADRDRVARVSTAGALVDAVPDIVAPAYYSYENCGSMATNGAGRALLVETTYTSNAEYRVRARFIDDGAPSGRSCMTTNDCASGYCVDGVCCDTGCGGGVADCQACSVAAGAAVDGTCAFLPTTHACRPSASACDLAESCTGTAATCPPDGRAMAGTVCRPASTCTLDATCDGSSTTCPANALKANGTACDTGDKCVSGQTCHSGVCGGTTVACSAVDDCHGAGTCAPSTGMCSSPLLPDGTGCADGGTCQAGLCGARTDGGMTGGEPQAEAGAVDAAPGSDAGADASDQSPGSSTGGCGCATAGNNTPQRHLALAFAALIAGIARRRARGARSSR